MTSSNTISQFHSSRRPWLTDGGLETSIIFHDGIDLPHFASFHLLESEAGLAAMTAYFERYIALARETGTGFVLDTTTWRSGAFWAETLDRSEIDLEAVTRKAVRFARDLKARHATASTPILINGVLGPAGDGYAPDACWTPEAAREIHSKQIVWLADAGADIVSALTMTHTGEAIGAVQAATEHNVPIVISFTVETDGKLPTGQSLGDAIAETDAATEGGPVFYMVNCAHPDHFSGELAGDWIKRIGGIRANASRMSHAELDAAETLDEGHPEEFGSLHGAIAALLPNLKLVGGCCGTDDRHVGCAARHVLPASGAHAA